MKNLLKIIFLMCIALTVKAQSELKVFTDWTSTSGTQYFYYKNKVKTDAGGNVYIAGATLNSSSNYDILVAKYNSSGVQQWIQQYNGAGNGDDMALGLFIGGTGNVYITGTVTTASNVDAITIKFNQYGVIQWVATYNGTGNAFDAGADVIEDGSYNVYITGSSFNASGNTDFITAKYNSGGTQQWVSRYDYASQMNDAGVKIAFRNGNLNVSGLAQTNSTTYRASTLTYNLSGTLIGTNFGTSSSSGIDQVNDMVTDASGNIYIAAAIPVAGQGYNYAIIKLSSSLSLLWERTYNGADNLNDVATGLKVDASGNVYATGYSTTSTQGKNIVTVKYNSSGTLQWSLTYNNALNTNDEANAMAIDASGNIYIAGFTDTEADGTDYFTIKYNASGNVVWTIQSDGNAHLNDKATDIAIDNNGDIVVTGQSETAPNEFEYLTIKYVEKYVITPTDYNSESPANSFSYYANKGQLINTNGSQVSDIKYYSTNSSPALYIKNYSHSYVFASIDTSTATNDTLHRIDITYDKVNASAKTYPLEERADYVNYFLSQCPDGITKVHGNQRLITTNLYSNIDLMYSSNQDGIKYYYIVKPGANPSNIHITFTGASSFYLDGSTNELTIFSSIGRITFERPTVYQLDASNNIIPITGWTADWVVNGTSNKYYFNIGAYDNTKPLIIQVDRGHSVLQPQANKNLLYSTYWGSDKSDIFSDIITGSNGEVYFTGYSLSTSFPLSSGLTFSTTLGDYNAIVLKLDNNNVPIWGTFYGGNGNDVSLSVALGLTGQTKNNLEYIAFCGYTRSSDFPCINNIPGFGLISGSQDIFIAKLNEFDGTALWATYFGGNGGSYEKANDLAVDNLGNLYAVGRRESSTPLVSLTGATNDVTGNAFIMKLNQSNTLLWVSAFGGSGGYSEIESLTIDNNNNVFILGATNSLSGFHTMQGSGYLQPSNNGGYDAFVSKFDNNSLLAWSTYWGGSGYEHAGGIASDNTGNIYITGTTQSTNFPTYNVSTPYDVNHGNGTTINYGDVFISKFDNNGNRIKSMYYGGSDGDIGYNIKTDNSNRVYVTGLTQSYDFPTPNSSPSALFEQSTFSNTPDQQDDAFLIALDQTLNPFWATYYGGGQTTVGSDVGFGLATFSNQKLYMVGSTNSKNIKIPLEDMGSSTYYQGALCAGYDNGIYQDGFLAMFDLSVVTAAINEINFSNGMASIFPNPVIDGQELQISIDLKGKTDIGLEIFDITGKCILHKTYSNFTGEQILSINMDKFAKGIYVLKLFENNSVFTNKIIKQ